MELESTGHNRLDERLIERCEDLPADLAPGAYVVIDTLHFSNTVIELLSAGAVAVHVPDERGQEFEYRATHPGTLIGGGRTADYEPKDGYDFFNSPSYVQRLDVQGRRVSMTSTNGGRTVKTLRERGDDDIDVYVGSPLNARAIGTELQKRDGPVHLVSAGDEGDVAIEDHVGAVLIDRYLDGRDPSDTELALFKELLETAKGPNYVEKHEIRSRDVREYAMNINGRHVVPTLTGDSLIRSRATHQSAAAKTGIAD